MNTHDLEVEKPTQFVEYQGVQYPVSLAMLEQIAKGTEAFKIKYTERLKRSIDLLAACPPDYVYLEGVIENRMKSAIILKNDGPSDLNIRRFYFWDQALRNALFMIDEE